MKTALTSADSEPEIYRSIDNDATLQIQNDGDDNLRLVSFDGINDWSFYTVGGANGSLELYKNGAFRGSFDATSGAYSASDKRLKKNINQLPVILENVMKLQPKKYHYNHSNDTKYSYGFIAQEVQEIFPDFVGSFMDRKSGQEMLTLKYDNFGVIAIKAIQEQQQQIEKQQQQNDELKKEVAELKQLINKLTNTKSTLTSLSDGALLQNAPNPVNGATAIQYSLPEGSSRGQLLITDALSRTIRAIRLTFSGVVNVDVSTLSSGVYNYLELTMALTTSAKFSFCF